MGSGASNSRSATKRAASYVPESPVLNLSERKECKDIENHPIEVSRAEDGICVDADVKVESIVKVDSGAKMTCDAKADSTTAVDIATGAHTREGASLSTTEELLATDSPEVKKESEDIPISPRVAGGATDGVEECKDDDIQDVGVCGTDEEGSDMGMRAGDRPDGMFNSNYYADGEELYHPYSHELHDDEEDDEEDGDEDEDSEAERNADLFAYSAMSLGIESDELLFNMLYFGTGAGGGAAGAQDPNPDGDSRGSDDESDALPAISISTTALRTMLNSTVEETVAAHSANNTPYKLRPACDEDLGRLKTRPYGEVREAGENVNSPDDTDTDCLVCSEELESGCDSIALPACGHVFHAPCILKWLKLVSSVMCCLSVLYLTLIIWILDYVAIMVSGMQNQCGCRSSR